MEPIPERATRMKITPEIAGDWLDNRNLSEHRPFNNRRISTHIVSKYAETMADGRWMLTHQGIAFDREGWLIDGQHRLKAILEAGVPVEMVVIPGCDPETFAVLDTGFRREAGHLIPVNGPVIATAARIIGAVTGAWLRSTAHGMYDNRATNDQILDVVDQWPELGRFARDVSTCYQHTRINKGIHLAIMAQAARGRYQQQIDTWLIGLKSGQDLRADDARLHLRNRFIRDFRDLNSAGGRGAGYRLVARAWNAYVQDKSVRLINPRSDLPPPEIL